MNRLPEGVKNYLIDLDGTVCDDIPNEEAYKMATAKVYPGALETLNKWYDEGHIITFFTSRIEEHFNMLLNQTSNISPNINELLPIQDIFKFELEDLFNIDELNKALFEMKDSKACGADRIPIEFFKYTSCEDMKKYIYYFFQQVLNRRRRNTRCYKKCNNFGNI